jgi:hypothetical protein
MLVSSGYVRKPVASISQCEKKSKNLFSIFMQEDPHFHARRSVDKLPVAFHDELSNSHGLRFYHINGYHTNG